METVEVQLPAALVQAGASERVPRSRKAIGVRALSGGEGVAGARRSTLRDSLEAFMDFAAEHGVPPPRYRPEELEEDRRSFNELGA